MGDILAIVSDGLRHELVQYWGVWAALGMMIIIGVRIGIPQYKKAAAALEQVGEIRDPDGRVRLIETKLRRIGASIDALLRAGRSALLALLPIVGLPLGILVLVTLMSDWFFGAPTVIVPDGVTTGSTEYTAQLTAYFLDQLSRGLFFDAAEVFNWQFSPLSAASENTPYLYMLLGFRIIVDLYVAGLAVLFIRAFWGVTVNALRLLNPI